MGAIHVLTERKRRRRQVCFSRLVDQNLPTKYQNRYKNSVPLLNRTPDGFTTTSAGQAILRQCEAMESAALALERVAAERDAWFGSGDHDRGACLSGDCTCHRGATSGLAGYDLIRFTGARPPPQVRFS
jgi:hypothetical protein